MDISIIIFVFSQKNIINQLRLRRRGEMKSLLMQDQSLGFES